MSLCRNDQLKPTTQRFGLKDYHPHQLAVCGFSGSGKTTFLTSLMQVFAETYKVGYAKHDGHHFSVDREGKDTERLKRAGAHTVTIANGTSCARIADMSDAFVRPLWFQDCDFVLIEGHKQAHFPKMLMLDAEGHAERACAEGEIQNVQAVVSCGHGATKTLKVLNEQGHEQKVEFPHFNRDDIQQSAEFILRFLMPVPPLSGLVLIGGQSKRMGQDKSKLQLQGKSQLEASVELCASVCDSVWVSGRSDQTEGHAFIADRLLDMGPIGGILSAMETHPDRAWLVMAVDMPWMSTDVLQELVHQRDPFAVATAYREPEGRFPEPLCAIYEPKAKLALYQFLGLGTRCPRKVLINTNTHLVHCSDPQALGNANTPEDIERWSAGTKPKIKP